MNKQHSGRRGNLYGRTIGAKGGKMNLPETRVKWIRKDLELLKAAVTAHGKTSVSELIRFAVGQLLYDDDRFNDDIKWGGDRRPTINKDES
jgi:hypothetical protein